MKQDSKNDTARPSKTGLFKRFLPEFCGTDNEYAPYHAYFFAFFAGIGAFLPYLALYFKQLGLSAAQAGLLFAVRPLSEAFVPLWGWIGDKYKKRKMILRLALISYTLSALITLPVQPKHQECVEREGNLTHSTPLEFSQSGAISLEHSQLGHETSAEVDSIKYQRVVDQAELNDMFAIILLITALGQIIGCVVFTFPEAMTIALLNDKADKFGVVRFLGEIGLAISSFTIGAALSTTETDICGQTFKNYFIVFYCLAAWMTAALVVTLWMKANYHDPRPDIRLKEVIRNSVVDLKSVSLLTVSVFLGSFQGLHESFGLWFLDDLGGSSLMLGVAVGGRYSFSTIGYITAQYFIRYFGVMRTLVVTLIFYGVGFCGFSLMQVPETACVIYILQGGLYSVSWCAVIAHVGLISQDTGYTASIQGVYSGVFWGLGYGGGALISGVLVQVLGVRITYQSFAAMAVLLCFPLIVVHWLTSRRYGGTEDVRYELVGQDKHPEDTTGAVE